MLTYNSFEVKNIEFTVSDMIELHKICNVNIRSRSIIIKKLIEFIKNYPNIKFDKFFDIHSLLNKIENECWRILYDIEYKESQANLQIIESFNAFLDSYKIDKKILTHGQKEVLFICFYVDNIIYNITNVTTVNETINIHNKVISHE